MYANTEQSVLSINEQSSVMVAIDAGKLSLCVQSLPLDDDSTDLRLRFLQETAVDCCEANLCLFIAVENLLQI